MHFAFFTRRAVTLIEILVVIGIIGMLTALITTATIYARRRAAFVNCQNNLHQIGMTLYSLAQDHGGLYADLVDAYPSLSNANDSGFPWWARVYQQLESDQQGGLGMIYAKDPTTGLYLISGPFDLVLNPKGHVPTGQLPPTLANLFHCKMAGALDTSSAANLFNSISYGINFNVKLANGTPYKCVAKGDPTYPALLNPPATAADFGLPYPPMIPSPFPFYISDMKSPGAFILVSEANTQDPNPASWTGGRIAMQATETAADSSKRPATRIVGRHDGSANVLYGDLTVHAEQAIAGGTLTNNINVNIPLWTLTGD